MTFPLCQLKNRIAQESSPEITIRPVLVQRREREMYVSLQLFIFEEISIFQENILVIAEFNLRHYLRIALYSSNLKGASVFLR